LGLFQTDFKLSLEKGEFCKVSNGGGKDIKNDEPLKSCQNLKINLVQKRTSLVQNKIFKYSQYELNCLILNFNQIVPKEIRFNVSKICLKSHIYL
jgi:hypothetical protein